MRIEGLESRLLLSSNPAWHNLAQPADVNGDSYVSPIDAFMIVGELRKTGPRVLDEGPAAPPMLKASASGTSESVSTSVSPHYLDVNGDGNLSVADVFAVVAKLRDQVPPDVRMRLAVVDANGQSIDTATQGTALKLNIYVQDARGSTVPDRGVVAAYLDVLYDSPYLSVGSPVVYSPEYRGLPDSSNTATAGLIDNLGNVATDLGFGAPYGPNEILLATVPFTVSDIPIKARDDSASTLAALSMSEDAVAVSLNLLGNDELGGSALFQGQVANEPPAPATDVFLWSDLVNPVANDHIEFVNDAVQLVAPGTLVISTLDKTGTTGSVAIAPDGKSVIYTPAASMNALGQGDVALDSFSYTITDGVRSATATVTVTLNGVNDAPIAQFATASTSETTVLNGSVAFNGFDNDNGDSVKFSGAATSALGATVQINEDGTYSYDPTGSAALNALAQGQTGADTFTFTVTDTFGLTASNTVTVTVTGVNDAPSATAATFNATANATLNSSLVGKASDPDTGDVLAFSGDVLSTLGATVTVNANGEFTYNPTAVAALKALAAGATLNDTFTYSVNDGHGGQASATVTIAVTGANDAPLADDATFATGEETTLSDTLAGKAHDPDTGDTLTFSSQGSTSALGAAIQVNADGSFTYNPLASAILNTLAAGVTQNDSLTYTVVDNGGRSASALVTITVTGVNDAPTAQAATFAATANAPLNASLATKASDPDAGDVLVFSAAGQSAKGAAVAMNANGGFSYNPTNAATLRALAAGAVTTDTFTYQVDDGHGGQRSNTVTITVTGVNDAPVAASDDLTVEENSTNNSLLVLANDADPDTGNTITISAVGTPNQGGTVSVAPDSLSLLYAPAAGYTGPETFTYTIRDGAGLTATATVTVNVEPPVPPRARNDAFTVAEDSVEAVLNVFANDAISEGGAALITITQPPNHLGTVTVDGTTIRYTPATNFVGTETFRYTLADGVGVPREAQVTVQVSNVNDAPVASNANFDTNEDTAIARSVASAVSDADAGETLTFSAPATSVMGAAIAMNADGSFTYNPTAAAMFNAAPVGAILLDSFTYTVRDSQGAQVSATVNVAVTGVNDPPVATAVQLATDEDSPATGSVAAAASDPDLGAALSFSAAATSTRGAVVTMLSDGSFTYDPTGVAALQSLAAGASVVDTFTYTVSDGLGGTTTAEVQITVSGRNDAPTAQPDNLSANEDAVLTGNLGTLANDIDVGDVLHFSGVATSALGATVTVNSNGTFSYDPTAAAAFQALLPGAELDDTFQYTVSDDNGGSATATVTVTVAGRNDPPVAGNDAYTVLEDAAETVFDVLVNDTFAPDAGETLTLTAVGTPSAGGAAVIEGSTVKYTPKADFNGDETFTYTISDGNGGTATATVTVSVTPQSDPPTAVDDTFRVIAKTGAKVLDVLANDSIAPDTGETLSLVSLGTPSQGGAVVIQDNKVVYTPAANFEGTETFTYVVSDGNGGEATGTVTVNVVAFVPSTISGSIYTDTDGDGQYDATEHGLGGIQVTLTGTGLLGPVNLKATTNGHGDYSFAGLAPGTYTLKAAQGLFTVDGADRACAAGRISANDEITITIGEAGGLAGAGNNFAEAGLQPAFVGVWDFLNTSSRKGVLTAIDRYTGQLWFSFLNGWEGFSSVTGRLSSDLSTLELTVVNTAGQQKIFTMPFRESAKLHIRGSVGTQYLVQLVGTPADFGLTPGPTSYAQAVDVLMSNY